MKIKLRTILILVIFLIVLMHYIAPILTLEEVEENNLFLE